MSMRAVFQPVENIAVAGIIFFICTSGSFAIFFETEQGWKNSFNVLWHDESVEYILNMSMDFVSCQLEDNSNVWC